MFLFLLLLFFGAYFGAVFYAGAWWVDFIQQIIPAAVPIAWPLFLLLGAMPIISRIIHKVTAGNYEILTTVGDYWLAVVVSSVFARAGLDLVLFLLSSVVALPQSVVSGWGYLLLSVVIFAAVLAYGFWNATKTVIQSYDISIAKGLAAGQPAGLKAVVASDLHLGGVVGKKRLEKLIFLINVLEADIVFLVGDNINDDVEYVAAHNITEPFGRLKSRHGVFAVLGNHEYIGGRPDLTVSLLENAGITVLRDAWIKVDDSFIVAGRDDISKRRHIGENRKSLGDMLAGCDASLPVILLDHQPIKIAEALEAGVDVMLSGHTHKGQFFPLNYVTGAIHENNWGLLKKGALTSIVTSGYGTWGPPIRIGSRSEVVVLNITVG